MMRASQKPPSLKKRKTFNRFNALQSEVERLQISKLKLLQSTSQEMQKLRTLINILRQIDEEKQVSPVVLQKLENAQKLHTSNTENDSNSIELNERKYCDLIASEYSQSSTDFFELQREIQRLRKSKFDVINTTNSQMNRMRQQIKLLMHRIVCKLDPSSELYKQFKNGKTEAKRIGKNINQNRNSNTNEQQLLFDYCKLSKDDVMNVMIMGTKCSGKTVLLRKIISLFDGQKNNHNNANALKLHITNLPNMVIQSIVSSVYDVLNENNFFESRNMSGFVRRGIDYFRENALYKYDAPILTKTIAKHISCILQLNINDNDNDADTEYDDYFVKMAFKYHKYYRNMFHFYSQIDKYCLSNWEINENEILLIWDQQTSDVVYYDILIGNNPKKYRFWDISSSVLYCANGKYKNDLISIFENINPECIVYVTSAIFSYQIEKKDNFSDVLCNFEQTAMKKSMELFSMMFESGNDENHEIFDGNALGIARDKWSLTPMIVLLNKSDVFRSDIASNWDESNAVMLTFPEYDGDNTYDAISSYLKIVFESFKMNHKRPFHIYQSTAIDDESVKTVVHHIRTVTDLYRNNTLQKNNNKKHTVSAAFPSNAT